MSNLKLSTKMKKMRLEGRGKGKRGKGKKCKKNGKLGDSPKQTNF